MSSLRQQAINGMAWSAVGKIFSQLVQFVIGIIIARILVPSDYGIIGMLGIFIALANTLINSGFGSALIQKQDRTDVDLCTAFWFNVVIGISIYLLLYFSAPFIADFYNVPLLCPVTRVYTTSLLFNSLCIVQYAIYNIRLDFKTPALINFFNTIITGVLGILLAYRGYGVWALVIQSLFSNFFNGLLLWYFAKWRPKLIFSYNSFKQLFSFGSRLLVSSSINTIYSNLYTIIIGKVLKPSDVGFYTQGKSYALLPVNTIQSILLQVNYPILAKLQNDRDRLISAYNKLLNIPLFILYPLLWGLIALGDPLISLLVGEKWLPCVPILQILCLGFMFTPLTHINLNLLYVKGRTDLVLKLELMKKPIGFSIVLVTMNYGLIWMVIGQALYEFIAFSFNCFYTGKLLNFGFIKQISCIFPIMARSMIMGAVVYYVSILFDDNLYKLFVGIVLGVVFYFTTASIMKDRAMEDLKNVLREKYCK